MKTTLKHAIFGGLVGLGIGYVGMQVYYYIQDKKAAEAENEPEVVTMTFEKSPEGVTSVTVVNDIDKIVGWKEPDKPEKITDVIPTGWTEEEKNEEERLKKEKKRIMQAQEKQRKTLQTAKKARKEAKYKKYEYDEEDELYEDPEEDELDTYEHDYDHDFDEERDQEPTPDYLVPEEGPREDPYPIDNGIFYEDGEYEKIPLLYYAGDDMMLIEGSNEIIEDPVKMLGDNWREAVGQYDANVAYIRNELYYQDYSIQWIDDNYEDL